MIVVWLSKLYNGNSHYHKLLIAETTVVLSILFHAMLWNKLILWEMFVVILFNKLFGPDKMAAVLQMACSVTVRFVNTCLEMACHWNGGKPFSKPMLTYKKCTLRKNAIHDSNPKHQIFNVRGYIWKHHLRNNSHLSQNHWIIIWLIFVHRHSLDHTSKYI